MSNHNIITKRGVAATGLFLGLGLILAGTNELDELNHAKAELNYSEGIERGYMNGRDLNSINIADVSTPEDKEFISRERGQQQIAQEGIDENLPGAVMLTFGGLALGAVSGVVLARKD